MAIRGVYNRAEEEMLREWADRPDPMTGWLGSTPTDIVPYPVFHRTATKEHIQNMGYAMDFENPLWRDERYAAGTRWGTIIAPPFYEQVITHGGPVPKLLKVPESLGKCSLTWSGSDWRFFRPIRPGDTFKVWVYSQTIEDVTREDGTGPRQFNIYRGYKYLNQNDELVTLRRLTVTATIAPELPASPVENCDYQYTDEEMTFLKGILDGETLRGAEILFWDDVNEGDELTPNANGPTTLWDVTMDISSAGLCVLSMPEKLKTNPSKLVREPVTGVVHNQIEWHMSNKAAQFMGFEHSDVLQVWKERMIARLVTRWGGDDCFIRKVSLKHTAEIPVGDAIITKGRVTKRYMHDGKALVDLTVWSESLRGYVTDIAAVTVCLPVRESLTLNM